MPGPLDGIRVFDLTLLMVGPWSTQNLGALGADVIHVERSGIEESSLGGGVPPSMRGMSVGYITWNMNKRELFLDLKQPADLEVAKKLISTCDVFVQNMRAGVVDRLGLSYEELSRINPRLVYVAITGWGETGPMAERPATDNRIQAFAGFASNNGRVGGDFEVYRHYTQLDATTGNYATQAVLLGLLARERTGHGQRIDISMLEAGLALQTSRIAEYLGTGRQSPPLGHASAAIAPSQAFLCQDRVWLGIEAKTQQQWHGLCDALGLEQLALDPRFTTNSDRVRNREVLALEIDAVVSTQPARWWQLRLNRHLVPNGRFTRFEELINHPQVVENGYIARLDSNWGEVYTGGIPWAFSRTPAALTSTALVGEHTAEILDEVEGMSLSANAAVTPTDGAEDNASPLNGLRVLELAQGIAGPYAGAEFADAGADVIKVEHGPGDVARYWEPRSASGEGAAFVQLNRGKRSVRLDLNSEDGQRTLADLIAGSDVLIEDADLTRELGLGIEALGGREGLVHLRISGFGPRGPWSGLPGSEIGAQLAAEVTSSLGYFGEEPVRVGADIANTYAGIYGFQGALAALYRRHRDAKGQRVDVSLFGCLLVMRSTLWAAVSNPDDWWGFHVESYSKPPEHGFKTKDGAVSFTVGRLPDEKWTGLLVDLGLDREQDAETFAALRAGGNPSTSRAGESVRPLWEKLLRERTTDEILAALERSGADGYPINDFARALGSPQAQHLKVLLDVTSRGKKVRLLRSPWRLRGTPARIDRAHPDLGEHTAAVLAELRAASPAVFAGR